MSHNPTDAEFAILKARSDANLAEERRGPVRRQSTAAQLDSAYQSLLGKPQRPVRHPSGYRSVTEERFAAYLELQVRAGVIRSWKYEAVTLALRVQGPHAGRAIRYCVDFLVEMDNGDVLYIEVKGRKGSGYYSREVGKMKVKLAAEMYPFYRFQVFWPGQLAGTWDMVELGGIKHDR